ncbi:MAG: 6,7-dimethyl-8-ribityllumazine synthase [Bacteroidota bacterium]|nr:6,7-dimethyl-8-ribityllumazine synthase [Bacteroidota bacterium]
MTQAPSEDYKTLQVINADDILIGIVIAQWNAHITEKLLHGAIEVLDYYNIQFVQIQVPGSFELPLAAQKLAQRNDINAVICLGCVVQGDTKHFDYVCQASAQGILEVGLKYNKPVIFGLLTTNDEQQALDRAGGVLGNKGIEAAITAIKMIAIL